MRTGKLWPRRSKEKSGRGFCERWLDGLAEIFFVKDDFFVSLYLFLRFGKSLRVGKSGE